MRKLSFCKKTLLFYNNVRRVHFGGAKSLEKYKASDKIPNSYAIVYRSPVKRYVDFAQITTLVAGSGLIFTAYYFYTDKGIFAATTDSTPITQDPVLNRNEVIMAALLLAATIITIQRIALKCVLRIYSNGTDYILVKNGLLGPVYRTKFSFKAGEASLARPSYFTIFNHCMYQIKNKKLIIFEHHFKTNIDYTRMIGQ